MASLILVTGGTGTLGRRVVPRLLAAGCRVRVLSRHAHEAADGVEYVTGDLLKNEGIPATVAGAEIIVHCAGGRKDDDVATRNLVAAASRAGHPPRMSHRRGGRCQCGDTRQQGNVTDDRQ